jgi:uncharacterized membrane protein
MRGGAGEVLAGALLKKFSFVMSCSGTAALNREIAPDCKPNEEIAVVISPILRVLRGLGLFRDNLRGAQRH